MDAAEIQQIRRDAIIWPAQERKHFGEEELAELAATIRTHGILEAIGVIRNGEGFTGIFGQRRWMAAGIAGLETVPAKVWEKPMSEAAAREIRLIENLARQSLNPIEQASGVAELMKAANLSASEAAKRVGMKPAAVTKSLTLLHLPEPIRQKISAGTIGAAAGYQLARIDDPKIQAEYAEQVASGALNRDSLAGRIKARGRAPASSKQAGPSRVTAQLSSHRIVTLRAASLTVDSVIATLEELLSRCRSARSKGLGLGTMLKVLADEAKAVS
jgi:ParB family chromosome partitioning protein